MTQRNDDEFARNSFSFRRMKGWQIWALGAATVVILVLYLAVL